MNAPARKPTAAKPADESPNLAIWNAVCRTDPKHTKKVNQRGGFTAIDAQYQFMEATRQFGPIGVGWGYEVAPFQVVGNMIVVPVTLWHGKRDNSFGPILGCAEMLGQRPDRDAPKKAITDAVTKGLSQLGFNADVFLGLFDDNKYVEEMRQEFGGPPANDGNGRGGGKDAPFPQGPAKNKTELKDMGRSFWRDVEACGDDDSLSALLATSGPLVKQLREALPSWWFGGTAQSGEPFEGLGSIITRMQQSFAGEQADGGDWRDNPLNGG